MEIAESRGASAEPLVRLQFYREPPAGSEQLDTVQTLCIARLRILKAVEEVGQDHIKGSKEYVERLKMKLGKQLDLGASLLVTSGVHSDGLRFREEVRRDVLSHFLLRLAMCRTEDQRRWFIAQETDLFRLRFQLEQAADRSRSGRFSAISAFLSGNGIKFDALSPADRSDMAPELLAATPAIAGDAELAIVNFYSVHFTEALDLVRSRRVYLRDGFAYVPESGVVSMVTTRFRAHLSHQLAVTCRALPYLGEDARLVPLLGAIAKNLATDEWSAKAGSAGAGVVLCGQVDQLAKANFPPCMQQLHSALRRDHHLKHLGRLQYGLFLKAIGMPLEEALKFWRTAFAGKVDGDKFAKEYAYGVRYNYGKEGKRADFSPYSCVRIITTNQPGQGDSHGCPFRHCSPDLLAQRLQTAGIGQEASQGILTRARDSQYQLACRDYFRVVHKMSAEHEVSINHPNQYFDESRALLLGNGAAQQQQRAPVRVTRVKASDLPANQGQAATGTTGTGSDWLDDTVDQEMSQVNLSAYEGCD